MGMHNFRALAASAFVTTIVVLSAGGASGAAASGGPPLATASTAADTWRWPVAVPHAVIRPFIAPESPYAAGHRGIDLAAEEHAEVLAPNDGVVSFAGRVVDRPVLSIVHPGDVITTVEPVIALVRAGERVRAGQRIGIVASGGHCPPGCLHFGVRSHGLYVSPLLYVGSVPRAILLPDLP